MAYMNRGTAGSIERSHYDFQIATFWLVRRIALPDVSARIERGEMSTALYLMMISIAVGILNAASMTA